MYFRRSLRKMCHVGNFYFIRFKLNFWTYFHKILFQFICTKANFKLEQINIVYSVEKLKLFLEIYFLKKNIMEFREARIEDRENVLKIEENAFTVSKDSDGDDYMDIVFEPWVKNSHQINLVLVKNGSILGFASGFPANQTDIQNSALPWLG